MIFILSDREVIEDRLKDAAGDIESIRTLPSETGLKADATDLTAIVIDGETDPTAAIELAHGYDELRPDVVVLLWAHAEVTTITQAMQAGVRDVFGPEADDDRIREVVKRALEASQRRRALAVAPERQANKMIMVMSPKGGAGKTTVATNLAVGLAMRLPRQVALVDGDLQFGDVANALRLQPETTVRDAIDGRLEESAEVKIHLTLHRSGLYVLCAPDLPGVADSITPKAFTRAVSLLVDDFRYVVVDTDPGLGERTLALMDQATDLVLVAATDVASVRGLSKTLQALDQIGLTHQTRHFVLNRADAKVGLDVDDINETIGMVPEVLIPSDRTMPISMNEGVPIVEGELDSRVAEHLWQLVDRFEPESEAKDAEREPRRHRRFL